ncbi:Uu.00g130950.m01.CDS01 [Anthostomella pinea]|uniref:Uu.00g130950.m01.CDS01 n=1 Tax=Anthostomella pinea TaxID=933095 RepID=A0AAI8YI85_9PEZI|nr:Uu.00g130950.m01.CDS01 [Anthostomella pinea]
MDIDLYYEDFANMENSLDINADGLFPNTEPNIIRINTGGEMAADDQESRRQTAVRLRDLLSDLGDLQPDQGDQAPASFSFSSSSSSSTDNDEEDGDNDNEDDEANANE